MIINIDVLQKVRRVRSLAEICMQIYMCANGSQTVRFGIDETLAAHLDEQIAHRR